MGFIFYFLEKYDQFLFTYSLPDGACLLTEAIECKRDRLIKKILEKRNSLKELAIGTSIGTPAHFCMKNLYLKPSEIKRMLINGLQPNSVDAEGNTCLHVIFRRFHRDKRSFELITDLFLKCGYDFSPHLIF